jgi:hypothetical protein
MNQGQNSRTFAIIASILIAALAMGVVELLRLRFSAGDVYPPYSSLRADPLGAKALYESLQDCCGLTIQRNYEEFSRIQDRFNATVMVLGFDPALLRHFPQNVSQQILYFINNGGRLVISFLPEGEDKQESLSSIIQALKENSEDFFDRWGVRIFYERDRSGSAFRSARVDAGLPDRITIHTALYFQTVHPAWETIYERNGHPVVIERKFGRGSLVLSAESYFFSNEALAKERQPALLLFMIGKQRTVIFDEYHHGVVADAGVMVLARRYHLEWLLAGVILLGALFVWKNAMPLVRPSQETETELETGKESTAGLTNLLRRNVPVNELLSVCFDQWRKSAKEIPAERKNRMEAILEIEEGKSMRQKNVPAAYNALYRAVKERRS